MDAAAHDQRSASLEQVNSLARLVWGSAAVGIWMESPNVFLAGARPIDVLLAGGTSDVVETLYAEMWGGAA